MAATRMVTGRKVEVQSSRGGFHSLFEKYERLYLDGEMTLEAFKSLRAEVPEFADWFDSRASTRIMTAEQCLRCDALRVEAEIDDVKRLTRTALQSAFVRLQVLLGKTAAREFVEQTLRQAEAEYDEV